MKTKYFIVFLLMLVQALKSKSENTLIFSPYKDNKYIVLNAKEEKCGQIVGHKILDTITLYGSISENLREKCYLHPIQNILVKKSTFYVYEKAFIVFRKIDNSQYIVRQGKVIKSFSVFLNKSNNRFNWGFLIPAFVAIIIGWLLSAVAEDKLKKYYKEKKHQEYYIKCFLQYLTNHKAKSIWSFFLFLFLLGFISSIFTIMFLEHNGIINLSPIAITNFLHLFLLIIFMFLFSFLIASAIKIKNIKQKMKAGELC